MFCVRPFLVSGNPLFFACNIRPLFRRCFQPASRALWLPEIPPGRCALIFLIVFQVSRPASKSA